MAQAFLEPTANGLATAWSGNGYLDVADSGSAPNDTTFTSSGVALDTRESYRVANVSAATIPTGSVINFVRIQARVQRGGTQNASFVVEIGYGGTPTWSPSGTLTATSVFTDNTFDWTNDPATGSAWTVATLRNWATTRDFGIRNTQTRDVRLSYMRIVVDYTPPLTPTGQVLSTGQGSPNLLIGDSSSCVGSALTLGLGTVTATVSAPTANVYAGPWPYEQFTDLTSLEQYVLAPVGSSNITVTGTANASVSLTGATLTSVLGTSAVSVPGAPRVVAVTGNSFGLVHGTLVSFTGLRGQVWCRTRTRVPRNRRTGRKRSVLTTVAAARLLPIGTRTVNGLALGLAQGTVQVNVPSSRTTTLNGITLGLTQGTLTNLAPTKRAVPAVQVVTQRNRRMLEERRRRTSQLTVAAPVPKPRTVVQLAGASLQLARGTVTLSGVTGISVSTSGEGFSVGQGTPTIVGNMSASVVPYYNGPWPEPYTSEYTSLDPYYLTPIGTTVPPNGAVSVSVVVSGVTAAFVHTSPGIDIPGGTRTVTIAGNALALGQGIAQSRRLLEAFGSVLTRSRKHSGWKRGRTKSVHTVVAPTFAQQSSTRTINLAGGSLGTANGVVGILRSGARPVFGGSTNTALGTVTISVSSVRAPSGIAITSVQGVATVSLATVVTVNLAGHSLSAQLGVATFGGQQNRTIVPVGFGVVSHQGTVVLPFTIRGGATFTVSPVIEKLVTVSFTGNTLVGLQVRVTRQGLQAFEGTATVTANPTVRYSGAVTTGGTASMTIRLDQIPTSVVSLFQQFEAEQQLGYKP